MEEIYDYELFEVVGEKTLKHLKQYPGVLTNEEVLARVNKDFPDDRPAALFRAVGISTPKYFEAFYDLNKTVKE